MAEKKDNNEIERDCILLEAYKVAAQCNKELLNITINAINSRDR
jgi:hypothetical protein